MGFMDKMMSADRFIILDTGQFVDGDFHHRNRIRSNCRQGYAWLTVPVEKRRLAIKDIRIDNGRLIKNRTWNEVHRKIIHDHYRNAPYYDIHGAFLNKLYGMSFYYLIDLNMAVVDYLAKAFHMKTPIIMGSSLDCIKNEEREAPMPTTITYEPMGPDAYHLKRIRATRRIIDMCKEAGGDTYISGLGGKNYLIERLFEKEGIRLEYQVFHHPIYKQCYAPFVPNLSALDYMMNVDTDAVESLDNAAVANPISIAH